jgi:hypothetical protein
MLLTAGLQKKVHTLIASVSNATALQAELSNTQVLSVLRQRQALSSSCSVYLWSVAVVHRHPCCQPCKSSSDSVSFET